MRKLAFIHPDLGIGGAEQLVVNLCLAGKIHGYQPHIYTPYHHQSFPQTHDGTIIIHEHGSFFGLVPDTVFGRFKGGLAYIRSLLCVVWLIMYGSDNYDAVVADQVSIVLPLLRVFGHKTIFYCHYPDKLLAGKGGFFKRIYRFFIDLMEEISLLFAHKIYVNSLFTRDVFYTNFKILAKFKVSVQVLYPSIDLSKFDEEIVSNEQTRTIEKQINGKYLLSLNRYERKKNINLAIEAYASLLQKHAELKNPQRLVKLVIAGGYDLKVTENIQHLNELKKLAQELNVEKYVHFYTSVSNESRKYLLKNAQCVLYTPQNEHFGIVPCEAMYFGVPIIADKSGGPKESVGEGCGYLCDKREDWSQNIWKIISGGKSMLNRGRKRVIQKFSFESFSEQFVNGVKQVSSKQPSKTV